MIFLFHSINMMYHIYWFIYVEQIGFFTWVWAQNRSLGWKGSFFEDQMKQNCSLSSLAKRGHWFSSAYGQSYWLGFLLECCWVTQLPWCHSSSHVFCLHRAEGWIQQWVRILINFLSWVKRQKRLQGQQALLFGVPKNCASSSRARWEHHLSSADV